MSEHVLSLQNYFCSPIFTEAVWDFSEVCVSSVFALVKISIGLYRVSWNIIESGAIWKFRGLSCGLMYATSAMHCNVPLEITSKVVHHAQAGYACIFVTVPCFYSG